MGGDARRDGGDYRAGCDRGDSPPRQGSAGIRCIRALGEPELGALLVCETDFDIAAAGGGDVSFTRDQTIMQRAPSCTFRYKFAPRMNPPAITSGIMISRAEQTSRSHR